LSIIPFKSKMYIQYSKYLLLLVTGVDASSHTISDKRIRNPDVTPALGRGFSLQSFDVLSTCLEFKAKTTPTANFDYRFLSYDHEGKSSSSSEKGIGGSVSIDWINAKVEANFDSKSSSKSNVHTVTLVTNMSMERYYSSIDDTTATLTPDAVDLLSRGDMVGFYQACGGGYIRSIRRTSEVSAVLKWSSTHKEKMKSIEASFEAGMSHWGVKATIKGSSNSTSTSSSDDTTLDISINAIGISLGKDNDNALIATSIEGYHEAMNYAYNVMKDDEIGVIHGVEIVPWADCLNFQTHVRYEDQVKQSYRCITVTELRAKCKEPNSSHDDCKILTKDDDAVKTDIRNKCGVLNELDDELMIKMEAIEESIIVDKDDNGNLITEDVAGKTISAVMLKLYADMNAGLIAMMTRRASNDRHTLALITACESDVAAKVLDDKRNLDRHLRSHNLFTGEENKEKEDIPEMKLETLQTLFSEGEKKKPGAAARTFSKNYNMFMNYQFQPCIEAMSYHMHNNMFLKPYTDLPECNKLGLCASTPGFTIKVEDWTEEQCKKDDGFKKGEKCVWCGEHDKKEVVGDLTSSISDIVSDWCMPEFVSRSVERKLLLNSPEPTTKKPQD